MSIPYQVPGLFLTALCHVIVIYHMLECRYAKGKFALYSSLYIVSFVCMGWYAYAVRGMRAIITYLGVAVCLFLFFCVVSRDCFSKKCFLFLTYFGLFSIIDNCLRIMVELFFSQLTAPAEHYLASVLRTAALLLILILYKKYAAPVIRSLADIEKGRWWKLALIALVFYLLQASLTISNAHGAIPKHFLIVPFIAVSFVMCVVYGVVFSNINYMKKDAEAALVRQNAEYLSSRLSVLQNAEEANRRLRHDMRHHIEAIAEYAKAGDTSAILTYIGEYEDDISEAAVKQYAVNGTINSILSVYAGKATECGILFSARCSVPEKLMVREIDLIALLGNLLENALHGSQQSGKENPSIKIHIRLQSDRLLIVCVNTCEDTLELADGLPACKSIGISSMIAVCEKYDGNLDYTVENGSCSVCAVLNL